MCSRCNQHYVIKFVSDLWQIGGFLRVLRFPPPMKLPATHNWNIVESGVKHYVYHPATQIDKSDTKKIETVSFVVVYCRSSRSSFQYSNHVHYISGVLFMFNKLRLEVIVYFVGIGEVVVNHWLNVLFIPK